MIDLSSEKIKKMASFMIPDNYQVDKRIEAQCYDCKKDGINYLFNLRTPGNKYVITHYRFGVGYGHSANDYSYMVSDDFDRISLQTCRKCKNPNEKKYSKNYWRYNHSFGSTTMTLYCFENGYCEQCAAEEAKKTVNRKSTWEGKIVRTNLNWLVGDDAPTLEHEYEDGTIYEEYPYGMPSGLESKRCKEL